MSHGHEKLPILILFFCLSPIAKFAIDLTVGIRGDPAKGFGSKTMSTIPGLFYRRE